WMAPWERDQAVPLCLTWPKPYPVSARCTAATRRKLPPEMAAVSLCEETGTGAGGRGTTAGTIGAALAVLARLAGGSAALGSAGLDSNCVASASMGRGRGSRLAATAGMLTTVDR